MRQEPTPRDVEGLIFDMDTFAVHDGPGIRMSVYFKGCPLACAWCHSPESQNADPQLAFARERCIACGSCVAACPNEVHHIGDDGQHEILWERCEACGRCVAVCAPGALSIKGYWIAASEVVERARRLKPFFDHSGGGITLTGGEVALQAEFAEAILRGSREAGIHTAIETCGAASWERLSRLLAHTDLVLYDIKLMDDAAHRRWTGASNRQILENASRLDGHNVQVRVPLIPGITDTEGNLRRIYAFLQTHGLVSVALLPYNTSAGAKYEWLDRAYEIEAERQTGEQLESFLRMARGFGLDPEIG
ncbi:MAG: glycyl-radical enzyme activating protein [Anaerolineae bacterium]|nr:glycyl-radical enzyme activating protein [Anaerolineae bacterium]